MKDVSTILDDIKLELSATLNAAEYMLWIDGLTPVCCSTTDIVVCAPSANARDTLEANYAFKFLDAATKAGYPINNVHFITEDEKSFFIDDSAPTPTEIPVEPPVHKKPNPFIPRYTFDNFVVGESNRLAFVTAQTVAENPGINDGLLTFNPLFTAEWVWEKLTFFTPSVTTLWKTTRPLTWFTFLPKPLPTNISLL